MIWKICEISLRSGLMGVPLAGQKSLKSHKLDKKINENKKEI